MGVREWREVKFLSQSQVCKGKAETNTEAEVPVPYPVFLPETHPL